MQSSRGRVKPKTIILATVCGAGMLILAALTLKTAYPVIIRAIGDYLIYESERSNADAIAILAGNPFDRGRYGSEVYFGGRGRLIIVTGENKPQDWRAMGRELTEAELTMEQVLRAGVPADMVSALPFGHSTESEAAALLNFCLARQFDTLLVVTSKFHTRRVRWIFRKPFRKAGITILITGAGSSLYDERSWWKSEAGLIALNNEYVKLLYWLGKKWVNKFQASGIL